MRDKMKDLSGHQDVVISGISGRYPESLNMREFWEKLLSGRELSSIDDRRWPVGEWQVVLSPWQSVSDVVSRRRTA